MEKPETQVTGKEALYSLNTGNSIHGRENNNCGPLRSEAMNASHKTVLSAGNDF